MPFCILYDNTTIATSALQYLSTRDNIDLESMIKDEKKYRELFGKNTLEEEDGEIMNFYRQLYS